ncbi:MAG TPA: SPFH domain-containing protein, partial [Candidatus Kapabacteria bacterium]|nr:SPFH domain-containing protein [Candidatus Kapabacteria bacterium]
MGYIIPLLVLIFIVFASVKTVAQGTVAVVTMFGKYRRIMLPGLNFKIPIIEAIHKRISIQNRSSDLEFQAITFDQANVYFKAMILYSVLGQNEETIKNVAFKFIDEKNFMQALVRTVEGTVRSFVATKKQVEILALRHEIVSEVKMHLDA